MEPGRAQAIHKTSSIPADPARAVTKGLAEIAASRGETLAALLAAVDTIVHGTTVTTNALPTRRGSRTALLVTEDFRDVLRLRGGTREEAYDNRLRMPEPLVRRELTLPVTGRLHHLLERPARHGGPDPGEAARAFLP